MPDELHSSMLRIAGELPVGDPTRRKILAVLLEASQSFAWSGDEIDEEYLPRGWDKALEDVERGAMEARQAINRYTEAQRVISRMDVPPEVVKMAERGIKTGRTREDSWAGIQNDPFSMQSAFAKAVKDGWAPRHMR